MGWCGVVLSGVVCGGVGGVVLNGVVVWCEVVLGRVGGVGWCGSEW